MTFAGKLFVMFNVALSLFFAVAAFGLYATSVDWGYNPEKPGTPGGILKEKEAEITKLREQVPNVDNRWREARAELYKREDDRRAARLFFAAQFDHNRTKASPADPVRMVEVGPDQLPLRDKANPTLPKMAGANDRAGQPLLSRGDYERQLEKARQDNEAVLKELQKEIARDVAETEKMLDKPPRRGLRTHLVDERNKREGVEEEVRLTRPLDVNVEAEAELVRKRMESLAERIKELEAYIKKRKMDVALSRR
jgi:hypothetical protein